MTGINCREQRHPPELARLLLRLKPGGPVVQRPRLCRRQFSDLWHPDRFPTELADAGCCLRLRSVWRLLRLLTDRLSGNNLRRRQYPKLQTLDVAEISDQHRLLPGSGAVAVRRLRREQCLQWSILVRSGRRYPHVGQGCALSVDAIYSHVTDSVALALAPGTNNAFGMPIPPFLPQTLKAAKISSRSQVDL
jgi:hypothetical protein